MRVGYRTDFGLDLRLCGSQDWVFLGAEIAHALKAHSYAKLRG
jgi:hypothetical protein